MAAGTTPGLNGAHSTPAGPERASKKPAKPSQQITLAAFARSLVPTCVECLRATLPSPLTPP